MSNDSDWYPPTRPEQRAMYGNVLAKIDNHKTTVDLQDAFVDRIKLICQIYIAIYDWLILIEATSGECYTWRDDMETNKDGEDIQPPPVFAPLTLPAGAFSGFVKEFRKKIAQLKEMDGYTRAIGEDLMIVRQKGTPKNPNESQPDLKFTEKSGFKVRVTGKMQGFKAVNIYYRRKGENEYVFVGYLTKLPGDITITPATPGAPEKGDIKAIFVLDNEEIGLFSPSTEVTLS